MRSVSTVNARSQFAQLLNLAQFEPVCITRHGRAVAIFMSPDEFRHMTDAAYKNGNPTVERLHAESATRWASVYETLAK